MYTIYYLLYTICYIIYDIYCTLYTIFYILYAICYILYSINTIYFTLYAILFILYTVYCILYTIYYILYTMYYVLYTIWYILHVNYYILYNMELAKLDDRELGCIDLFLFFVLLSCFVLFSSFWWMLGSRLSPIKLPRHGQGQTTSRRSRKNPKGRSCRKMSIFMKKMVELARDENLP